MIFFWHDECCLSDGVGFSYIFYITNLVITVTNNSKCLLNKLHHSTNRVKKLKKWSCYPQGSECLLGRSCSNVHVHLNDPGPTITCHNNLVTHFNKYCPDQIAPQNLKSQIQYNSISTNRSQGNLTHVLRRRFLNTIIFFCAELTSGKHSSKV